MVAQTGASAAAGICRRRGLGKIRHLAVADLWVQDRLRTKDFILSKIGGPDNPADALTKHLDQSTLRKHLDSLGLVFEGGRADCAPELAVAPRGEGEGTEPDDANGYKNGDGENGYAH